jgi:hypothetical protein
MRTLSSRLTAMVVGLDTCPSTMARLPLLLLRAGDVEQNEYDWLSTMHLADV